VKREPITPGTLLALRDPNDQWNTTHQRERLAGIVLKVHLFENEQDKGTCAYHILFSNGAYELEMEGYVRNVYRVVG